jgi:hypothetical protein
VADSFSLSRITAKAYVSSSFFRFFTNWDPIMSVASAGVEMILI